MGAVARVSGRRARRVVASNWLVDDEAAASLVSLFCGGLAQAEKAGKTVDYAASLQEAKRWVREAGEVAVAVLLGFARAGWASVSLAEWFHGAFIARQADFVRFSIYVARELRFRTVFEL